MKEEGLAKTHSQEAQVGQAHEGMCTTMAALEEHAEAIINNDLLIQLDMQ